MAKPAKKLSTYLLFDTEGIAYEFESDIPFTGTSIIWYDNGQKRAETTYVDGKREGVQREWRKADDNEPAVQLIGALEWLSHYKDNKLHGEVASFRKSGTKDYSTTYNMGEDVGPAIYYDKDGTMESMRIFEDGELQKIIWFDKTGKREQERVCVDGEPGDVVLFYDELERKDYELHLVPGAEEESRYVFYEEGNPHERREDEPRDNFLQLVTYVTNIIAALFLGMIGYRLYRFIIRLLTENGWIAG